MLKIKIKKLPDILDFYGTSDSMVLTMDYIPCARVGN